jgi:hypothetical protein
LDGCFAKVQAELEAMSDAELMHVNLEPLAVVGQMMAAFVRVEPLRWDYERLYDFDIAVIDRMTEYAGALEWADGQTVVRAPSVDVGALMARGKLQRDMLLTELKLLVYRGVIDSGVLKNLRRMHGAKNIAGSLMALGALYDENWAVLEGNSFVTREYLSEATSHAVRLLVESDSGKIETPERRKAMLVRQRAYTRCMQVYGELRSATVYLRRKHGDADKLVPSIFSVRGPRRRKKGTVDSGVEDGKAAEKSM